MPLTRLPLTTGVSGTLAVGNGGTGVTNADDIGNFVKIDSQSGTDLSSVNALDIDLPDTYKAFKLDIHFKPKTDGAHLYFRFSTDGGSSFYSGSSDYGYAMTHIYNSTDNITDNEQDSDSSQIFLSKGLGNNTGNNEGFNAVMNIKPIHTESSKNQANQVTWAGTRLTGGTVTIFTTGTGILRATQTVKVDACRLLFNTGDIREYFYHLWGEK